MTQWAVIVAVKPLSTAKSRLNLSDQWRRELALAMLSDTLAAVAGVPDAHCLVVTDDAHAAAVATAAGMVVCGGEPAGGLNEALTYGALTARQLWGPVRLAVLPADLPAMRVNELSEALDLASPHQRAFVVDADGAGTTLLCAAEALRAHYGTNSASRHLAGGAVALDGDWPGLRRDVDTLADLTAAVVLGVGRHTAEMWSRLT